MTNAQNRKRWAISQQKLARSLSAQKRIEELSQEALRREWQNMLMGNFVEHTLREMGLR